jgi:mono/diheme cytochrome c family protein
VKRWLGALFVAACAAPSAPAPATVVVRVPAGIEAERLRVSPNASLLRTLHAPDQIELVASPGRLRIEAPGACPAEVEAKSGERAELELRPLLSARAGDQAQLGFDAPFTVTLTPGCREALTGKIEWRQLSGTKLELAAEQNGFVLRSKTAPLSATHPEPLPWGIVPLSPRTRGSYELEATWRSGAVETRLRVSLHAAARATGLPSVAVGQRVLLGGAGWRVKERGPGGKAEVETRANLSTFAPDARGRWVLADGQGRELAIFAGTHDATPLDCGRSDCHAKEARASEGSPMQNMLRRGLEGALGPYPPECALGCHSAGEPGLADGGFAQVLGELGLPLRFESGARAWDDLPRALRRLGGVTCTACHGPGAIPEDSARWAILRSDVCATCHDAPPTYLRVEQWSATNMARADRDPEARHRPECRACHTTAGFLHAQGARNDSGPPAGDPELGIGCAACHAVHGAHLGRALGRAVRLPEGAPSLAGPSRVCLPCHAATLLLGGAAPPHAAVLGGCLGCHGGASGAKHDFRVDRSVCSAGCHATGVPAADPSLATRAARLWQKLGGALGPRPPHAGPTPKIKDDRAARALEQVRLVLEDPAASVHDPGRARALLQEAEAALAR